MTMYCVLKTNWHLLQVLSQILKKSPTLLTQSDGQNDIDIGQLFQCGCGCLGFPESGPVK